MEVSAEAKRIMVVALGKLYSSRTQRGGLRLHRSLLLSLVMKSARDIYHEAQAAAETVEAGGEHQHPRTEKTMEPAEAHLELRGTEQPQILPREQLASCPTAQPCDAHSGAQNKENVCPTVPAQHSRKRRGKTTAEPDFLPCKKAKLEKGVLPYQLSVNSVFMDYVTCSNEVGAPPTTVPLQRVIAAC